MNWKKILSELFSTGLTQAECAILWGVGQATVSDIATGKTLDPRGSLCMSIMATHAERVINKAAAPMVEVPLQAGDALGYVGKGLHPAPAQ
jgi:predicted XRE-type DNA-binding protein